MRTTTGTRRIERSDDERTERRWRLGFFVALSSAVLVALAALAQEPPARMSIRPTGPMPSVNIP
ncbi:hypothetical protein [Bradyrhizobium sp.]|jgi:hypothetical protein|uniref:hypothetical protein n=1 Tax=Bradyrhizobium sp. TaxID=376 RepID=UPI002DDD3423|nr:hypothetical protein [Bradyrhizobium sp.]HEV2155697.1 hypothetical protein [Bradyrhizobium sp.]